MVDSDPRSHAAAALRRLGHAFVAHEVDERLLERVAREANRVAADLEATPPRQRDPVEIKRRMFDVTIREGDEVVHFNECFVSGPWNPMGIAIGVHREGDEAVAIAELGAAFEGAPGRAHGGIVAAIFDDVLGYLLTFEQQPGFTGELTVRYLAPTPIREVLEFRSRPDRRDGRKLYTSAEARTPDGTILATAQATFIAIESYRMRR